MANTTPQDAAEEILLLYHATSRAAWDQIQSSGRMLPSSSKHDWLGAGIYFWQSAPIRAWMWKRFFAHPPSNRLSAEETVVLEYRLTVSPVDCLDLLDIRWHKLLSLLGRTVLEGWRIDGIGEDEIRKRLQRNARASKPYPHYLDCDAINQVCDYLEHRRHVRIKVVRAAFQHLGRLYPHSAFREGDHVQVAVRDPELIVVSGLRETSGLDDIEPRFASGLKKGT